MTMKDYFFETGKLKTILPVTTLSASSNETSTNFEFDSTNAEKSLIVACQAVTTPTGTADDEIVLTLEESDDGVTFAPVPERYLNLKIGTEGIRNSFAGDKTPSALVVGTSVAGEWAIVGYVGEKLFIRAVATSPDTATGDIEILAIPQSKTYRNV